MADRMKLPNSKGVMVQEVKPSGFADNVGVSRGDVILEINKQPVNSESDFRKLQTQLKSGQDVVFLVRPRGLGPNGGTVFMGGTLP
jgi:serine protease Do